MRVQRDNQGRVPALTGLGALRDGGDDRAALRWVLGAHTHLPCDSRSAHSNYCSQVPQVIYFVSLLLSGVPVMLGTPPSPSCGSGTQTDTGTSMDLDVT